HVGADGQRHEVVALVVTGVFLCCAALLVGGVVIVALLAVGRLVIRAGLIVSAWLLGASLDVAGRPVLGTVAIAARQVPTRARFGSVATLSRAPGGVFLARLHAGVLLRVDLVAVERHRTNVSISRVRCQGLWSRAWCVLRSCSGGGRMGADPQQTCCAHPTGCYVPIDH